MTMDPSRKSATFTAMTAALYKVDALVGGTESMRAAGKTLLPQHAEESDDNYATRLNKSTLVNYYSKAIDAAIGHVFKAEMKVENFPGVLSPLLKDIDGTGSTFDQFSQEGLWNTINHGVHYFVVDYPVVENPERTLADLQATAARTYVYPVHATQALAAYAKTDSGQERCVHFRWITTETKPSDDYLDEKRVEVVKAYDQELRDGPVTLTEWRKDDQGWITDGPQPIVGVTEIPVVGAYGWRTGFMTGRPVLTDLADLNVAHWQSLSEQTNILSVARVPFLHVAGDNLNQITALPDGQTKVEPFKLTIHAAAITGKDTSIEWVETSGSSIQAGAENITYLEEKMDAMGLVPTTSKSGGVTATETAINAAESSAQLKALAVSFGQSLSKVLYLMSQFEGTPAPTVNVSLDASFEVPTTPQPSTTEAAPAEAQPTT